MKILSKLETEKEQHVHYDMMHSNKKMAQLISFKVMSKIGKLLHKMYTNYISITENIFSKHHTFSFYTIVFDYPYNFGFFLKILNILFGQNSFKILYAFL